MNATKIVCLSSIGRNLDRDYQRDMMKVAMMKISRLTAEIEALKKRFPPAPFCEFMEN